MASLLTTAYTTNKLYKHTGFSATITSSLAITGALGVVWKDPDVYWANTNYNSIKKGTGFTATVASSIATYCVDMDFAGSNLIVAQDSTKLIKYTGFSATVSASFVQTGDQSRGIAWDGTNAITCGAISGKVRLRSGFSSTVTNSFTSGAGLKSVTWDGTNVIVSRNAGYKKYTGFSSTVSDSIAMETGNTDPYGMDWDGFPAPAVTVNSNFLAFM